MTESNFPTFDDIAAMDADDQRRLSRETMAALQADLVERADQLKKDNATFTMIKGVVWGNDTEHAFKTAQKDTGTVTLPDAEGYRVKAKREKSVDWDQKFLAGMYAKIKDAGDDPDVFIKATTVTAYAVLETTFKGWPEEYQKAFMPGRTVTPGKTVFTIELIKEKAT